MAASPSRGAGTPPPGSPQPAGADAEPVVPPGGGDGAQVPPCWHECGRTFLRSQVRNEGSSAYPRWCCEWCFRASRALSRLANSEAAKKELRTKRRTQQALYKQEVVVLSHVETNSSPNNPRAMMSRSLIQQLCWRTSVETTQKAKFLSLSQYVQWATSKGGIRSSQDAEARWNSWQRDPRHPRERNHDGEETLAVLMPKTLIGRQGAVLQGAVVSQETADPRVEDEPLLKRARTASHVALTDGLLACPTSQDVFRAFNISSIGGLALADSIAETRLTAGTGSSGSGSSGGSAVGAAAVTPMAAARLAALAQANVILGKAQGVRGAIKRLAHFQTFFGETDKELQELGVPSILKEAAALDVELRRAVDEAKEPSAGSSGDLLAAEVPLLVGTALFPHQRFQIDAPA